MARRDARPGGGAGRPFLSLCFFFWGQKNTNHPPFFLVRTHKKTHEKSTTGYLVGSIEGRVAVQHVEDALAAKNFTFKCHREGADIYAVNAISFHPLFGTFVTAGSDGAYNFWDKDSKQRLKAMQKANAPIPAGTFNRDGSIFAYAVSYDWSHGFSQHNPATARHHILLHPSQEAEVMNRARAKR